MSINSNMKNYILEEKIKKRSLSGATKETWGNEINIKVSFYPVDERMINNLVELKECTYTGLTTYKNFKNSTYRLSDNKEVYSIIKAKGSGKYTQLFLKELSNV